jgi:hypothetical protein
MLSRRGKAKGEKGDLERPRLPEKSSQALELLKKIQLSAQEAGLDQISAAEIDAEIAAYRAKDD